MNKCYGNFIVLLLLMGNYLPSTYTRVYLAERIERILNEARRIKFSDKIAEERYLHSRITQCLNQNMVNINQLKQKAQRAANLRNKNFRRGQKLRNANRL